MPPEIDIAINNATGGDNSCKEGSSDFIVQGPDKMAPTDVIAVTGQNWNGNYEIYTWPRLEKMKSTIDGKLVNTGLNTRKSSGANRLSLSRSSLRQ